MDNSYADLMASWSFDFVMRTSEVFGCDVVVSLVAVGVCSGNIVVVRRFSSVGRFTTFTVRSTSTSCCACVDGCCVRTGCSG